jgi:GTP-binding protein
MGLHSGELTAKPTLLALNKVDLLDPDAIQPLVSRITDDLSESLPVLAISATTGFGRDELLIAAQLLLGRGLDALGEARVDGGFRLYRGPRGLSRDFFVDREGEGFRVAGESLERLIAVTDLDDDSSVLRLQRQLVKIGVERALLRAGAKEGDEVQIGNEAFNFYPDPDPERTQLKTGDDHPD